MIILVILSFLELKNKNSHDIIDDVEDDFDDGVARQVTAQRLQCVVQRGRQKVLQENSIKHWSF